MSTIPWASVVVLVPLIGALVCGVVAARRAATIGVVAATVTVAAVGGLVWQVWTGGAFTTALGGWRAPLGIELYVDGLAALMLAVTAVVGFFISVYSVGYFHGLSKKKGGAAGHHEGYFWSLWLVVWAGLHGVFVSADLFNLYVCIEVVGLGSVALVALTGAQALKAAMRYLLVTLCGSLLYLLGVALIYGGWGRLDIAGLSLVVEASTASEVALAVMTLGLVLKTALVPLHFWLPAAHANAPAPVSAVLSALVVKASFFMLLRLWIEVFGAVDTQAASMVLAALGTVAILWGSIQALRQTRLKMLVAYSTVAQLGYLFIAFAPAAVDGAGSVAWHGVAYFIVAHACAKGAMFLSAGAIAAALGSDRFSEMRGAGLQLVLPLFAFALAGVSLMGLPPSGGYTAKWLLLTAATQASQPLMVAVINIGGLLTAMYVFKVIYYAFARRDDDEASQPELRVIPRGMMVAALLLAVVAIGLGLGSIFALELLDVGAPFGQELAGGLEP